MSSHQSIIQEIALEATLLFLIIGALFALLLGLLHLFSPNKALKLSQNCSRWYSLRRTSKVFDIPHTTNQFFYRYHRSIGLFTLLASSYILYRFAFDYDHMKSVTILAKSLGNRHLAEWALEATLWLFIPLSTIFIIFGAIMTVRPSMMKNTEELLNSWISTRKALQPLEKQHNYLDDWAHKRSRLFGFFLVLIALYILSVLLMYYFNNVN